MNLTTDGNTSSPQPPRTQPRGGGIETWRGATNWQDFVGSNGVSLLLIGGFMGYVIFFVPTVEALNLDAKDELIERYSGRGS